MRSPKAGIGLLLLLLLTLTTACQESAPGSAQSQASLAAMHWIDGGSMCIAAPGSTMASSFFMLLGAGLLIGLSHCIGMCGPLVGSFVMRRRAENQEISTPLLLFQTGRLTTYTALGLATGSFGATLAMIVRDWQGIVSLVLGVLVVLLGLGLLGLFPLQHWIAALAPAHWVGAWMRRWMTSNHPAAPVGLGIANGLLPCGPVYAMALLAATSGGPLKGASLMLIFGLGTLPAMLGLGFSTSLLSIRLRSHLYRTAAVLVVAVGVQLTLRGLAAHGHIPHTAIGSVMLW